MILRLSGLILAVLMLSGCMSFFNRGETATPTPVQPPIEAGERVAAEPGDTVYSLSRRYGIPMRELIALNRLPPPYALSPGMSLLLPAKPIVAASVAKEPASTLAPMFEPVQSVPVPPPKSVKPVVRGVTMYRQEVEKPAQTKLDAVVYPSSDKEGMADAAQHQMNLPDPTLAAPAPARMKAPSKTKTLLSGKAKGPKSELESGRFIWPLHGTVLASFGKSGGARNDGVNISAPRGTPVAAADGGTVVYAGADIPGYGNVVILRHTGDYMTTYAHLERMFVMKDSTVAKGDVIGTVGSTGGLVTPQLHFEIRRGADPLDPKKYLVR